VNRAQSRPTVDLTALFDDQIVGRDYPFDMTKMQFHRDYPHAGAYIADRLQMPPNQQIGLRRDEPPTKVDAVVSLSEIAISSTCIFVRSPCRFFGELQMTRSAWILAVALVAVPGSGALAGLSWVKRGAG
jgi:hypothetical protein